MMVWSRPAFAGNRPRPLCDYLGMSTTPTPPPSHEAISHRAHALWEEAGRPEGRDVADWLQAEKELLAQQGPETPSAPPAPRDTPGLKERAGAKKRPK
jgi:hypothetical protein